jgi:hypothetical protein
LNVTVPVGVEPDTVAVKVTFCPTGPGFGDDTSVVDVAVKPMVLVALPDVVAALPALAVTVLVTGAAAVPAATRATMLKLYVPGAAEAIEHVTVPGAPTAGVVQVQTPPGPVWVVLTKRRLAGRASDSEALVAVPALTVSVIE